ncbi:hypothetical protein ACS0TY_016884 [Phlomoides rotata]
MWRTGIIAHDPEFINAEQTYDVFILDKTIFTTVTSFAQKAHEWIRTVVTRHRGNPLRLIVGLEIKFGIPDERSATRRVALLALCVYRSCLIYELTYAELIPTSLFQFLTDPNNVFVGVGIESKMLQMQRDHGIGIGARYVDLGNRTAERYNRPGLNYAGLSQLRTFLHGRDVQRLPVDDNWDEEELSNEHVHHASIDAYVCYELGSYLVYPLKKRSHIIA